jgi:hypothetical protein
MQEQCDQPMSEYLKSIDVPLCFNKLIALFHFTHAFVILIVDQTSCWGVIGVDAFFEQKFEIKQTKHTNKQSNTNCHIYIYKYATTAVN